MKTSLYRERGLLALFSFIYWIACELVACYIIGTYAPILRDAPADSYLASAIFVIGAIVLSMFVVMQFLGFAVNLVYVFNGDLDGRTRRFQIKLILLQWIDVIRFFWDIL